MGGEKTGLSFTGERKDWAQLRKRRKFFDEKNMGWAITTGATMGQKIQLPTKKTNWTL